MHLLSRSFLNSRKNSRSGRKELTVMVSLLFQPEHASIIASLQNQSLHMTSPITNASKNTISLDSIYRLGSNSFSINKSFISQFHAKQFAFPSQKSLHRSFSPLTVRCNTSSSSSDSQTETLGSETTSDGKEKESFSNQENGSASKQTEPLPSGEMTYKKLEGWSKFVVQWRMLTAIPWRRVKKGSIYYLKLNGPISELRPSTFSRTLWLQQICVNIQKAAMDPRISGLVINLDLLDCGWGKIDEIRRQIEFFKQSGKFSIAYMSFSSEKEFYLASICDEVYCPSSAYINLRGLSVQGQFLGGVLEKVGIEPQVQRIGKYKSAGDQLSRKDMSEPNREMLTQILTDIYENWSTGLAASRGKTVEDLEALLEEGVLDVKQLKEGGWITDIKYDTEIEEMLKERIGVDKDKPLPSVDYRKYSYVNPKTVGLGIGKDKIAVLRASGAISRTRSRTGSGISSENFIKEIRAVKKDKKFKAVILRIDSPGGDALASDLMWNEIRLLAKEKPIVASMADVAASGGYYMAMAAPVIISEPLTLTGSIGVVLGKFNLKELYSRIGFNKEIISKGKFAELLADQRSFNPEEEEFYSRSAQNSYKSFRDKAALSRSMAVEEMEESAQGRVWTGKAALSRNLIDGLGGFSRAVAIAKAKAGISEDTPVRLVEISTIKPSLGNLLALGGAFTSLLGLRGSEERAMATRNLMEDMFFSSPEIEGFMKGEPLTMMEDVHILGSSFSDDVYGKTSMQSNLALINLLLQSFTKNK